MGVDGNDARIASEGIVGGQTVELHLRITDMSEARLVLTDDLVTEALRRSKAAGRARRLGRMSGKRAR